MFVSFYLLIVVMKVLNTINNNLVSFNKNKLRSTCDEQWMGRTHHTPAWRSTSAGRWRGKRGWSKSSDLLLHPVSNTRVHSGASRHDSVGIQVLTDVNITLHDGVVGGLVDATGFHSKEGRLEESLRAAETLIANGDDLAVGKLMRLLKGGGGSSSGHFLLEVKGNIAELLLDVTDNLTLSSGGEE